MGLHPQPMETLCDKCWHQYHTLPLSTDSVRCYLTSLAHRISLRELLLPYVRYPLFLGVFRHSPDHPSIICWSGNTVTLRDLYFIRVAYRLPYYCPLLQEIWLKSVSTFCLGAGRDSRPCISTRPLTADTCR